MDGETYGAEDAIEGLGSDPPEELREGLDDDEQWNVVLLQHKEGRVEQFDDCAG